MAAFRSGIAIAQSDGSEDIEYLKEIYGCVPAYLARFVLWQHAVSLCFLRAPSYANALSAALYKVGAFFQQDWLVSARLEQMDSIGALVRTGTIALLHLWSVDIGTEARFFDKYVALLLPHTNGRRGGDSFWQQFVPASMLQDTRAYRKAVRGNDSGTDDDVSGSQTGTRISRLRKVGGAGPRAT
ncbi:hypothetical protein DL89DRAFT_256956 [Linderina pennispora]|uniref:Uncharacterized protein n=1 Tax=Linderina pennispora TaxID=61395 RepID=A0A1Y1WB70_9FUNG|nr:uncharacterized protein DL89DRAFT_256956 [Linderina pennispora]ORX70773.1 hypothetical protein DL89DRAFT_256956 [Linderina pennispora]